MNALPPRLWTYKKSILILFNINVWNYCSYYANYAIREHTVFLQFSSYLELYVFDEGYPFALSPTKQASLRSRQLFCILYQRNKYFYLLLLPL